MASLQKIIGDNMKKYRSIHGLTQKALAEAVNIDYQHYARAERGERQLALEKMIDICEHYHITFNELLDMPVPDDNKGFQEEKYEAVCNRLKNCTGVQLAVLDNLIDELLPHIK